MIRMSHRPKYLPQVHAPVDEVLKKLDEEGVDYKYIQLEPEDLENLKISQGFVLSDEINNVELDDMNPIWVDNEDHVCDGHHRYTLALSNQLPIKAIRIDLNHLDACRLLNKIQDIYEYEENQQLEEVEMQDAINANNETNSGVSYNEFLESLEENNANIQSDGSNKNQQTVIAYRREPIKENSVIGNFFTLNPMKGFTKYEIDFDNLLDTHQLGVTYKDGQEPIDILTKIWFPHINFEKLSEEYNIPVANLKNKAIAEKAQTLGYDGIKHGDKIIQGLK